MVRKVEDNETEVKMLLAKIRKPVAERNLLS